jgi:hypothetical protein
MAATRGQQIQERYHRHVMWRHFLCRLDREAGAKARGSTAKLVTREPAC